MHKQCSVWQSLLLSNTAALPVCSCWESQPIPVPAPHHCYLNTTFTVPLYFAVMYAPCVCISFPLNKSSSSKPLCSRHTAKMETWDEDCEALITSALCPVENTSLLTDARRSIKQAVLTVSRLCLLWDQSRLVTRTTFHQTRMPTSTSTWTTI